jgi:hypothetical protein
MLESNPPRNSQLQTHRSDGSGGGTEDGFASTLCERHRLIDLPMPQKTHSEFLLPRLLVELASCSLCWSRRGTSPALRRSLSR